MSMSNIWQKIKRPLLIFLLIFLVGGFGSLVIQRYIAPFLASQPVFRNLGFLRPDSPIVITRTEQIRVNENVSLRNLIKQLTPTTVSLIGGTGTVGRDWQTRISGTAVALSSDGLMAADGAFFSERRNIFQAVTADGQVIPVSLIGIDPKTGVALLKLQINNLSPVQFGLSSDLETGQQMLIISGTASPNSVKFQSAYISTSPDVVTDANAVYSSESFRENFSLDVEPAGGSLIFNLSGQLTGLSLSSGRIVPAESIKAAQDIYLANKSLVRPVLGVNYSVLNISAARLLGSNVSEGVVLKPLGGIPAVVTGSPAARAGLQTGDILTRVNGDNITLRQSLDFLLNRFKPGDNIRINFRRGAEERETIVTLGEVR